jgi:hypothetical protein
MAQLPLDLAVVGNHHGNHAKEQQQTVKKVGHEKIPFVKGLVDFPWGKLGDRYRFLRKRLVARRYVPDGHGS